MPNRTSGQTARHQAGAMGLPRPAPGHDALPYHHGQCPALRAAIDLLRTLRALDPEFPIQYALCLGEIARHQHLSVTELAQRTDISLSTVSRIISTLSNRKGRYGQLINVRFSRVESRRKELSLTTRGHDLIANMTKNLN